METLAAGFSAISLLASGGGDTGLYVDLFILFGVALAVCFVFEHFRIPSIVGFLLTGIVCGPHGLKLIDDVERVNFLADVGTILLLFTIGLEFSVDHLLKMKNAVLSGGTLQAVLTGGAFLGVTSLMDQPLNKGIFFAFLTILSSTAIVLKLLAQRGEMEAPQGRLSMGILIFQDLLIVPMMLAVPFLAGTSDLTLAAVPLALGKAVGIFAVVAIVGRWGIPWLFFRVATMQDRELFLLCTLFVGLGVAWLTSLTGLSIALGAFLAGLLIAESEYSHRALGSILPFKDVFLSIFFISVGMLLDVRTILNNPSAVAFMLLVVMLIKVLTAGISILVMGYPLKTAALTGFALFQIGEFSFVLSKEGVEKGLLTPDHYQLFLATSVLTMMATPFMMARGSKVVDLLGKRGAASTSKDLEGAPHGLHMEDHVIIVGYGTAGKYLAASAKAAGIKYVIVEMNPHTVRAERERGEPIFYGDASQDHVLEIAGIHAARSLVAVIPDPAAVRRIVSTARSFNPNLHIVVRVRFLGELKTLEELGANEVVPEEFETALELISRVLKHYMVPVEQLDEFVAEARADGYAMLRSDHHKKGGAPTANISQYIPDIQVSVIRVKDRPLLANKTLVSLDLRNRFGVTVLAVRRMGETMQNPEGKFIVEENDELIVLGIPRMLSGMVRKMSMDAIPKLEM